MELTYTPWVAELLEWFTDIFFFELAGDMSLYEGGFADSTITNQYYFELRYVFGSLNWIMSYLHFNFSKLL